MNKGKREIRNTILIALGLTAISLMFLFHLVGVMNNLLIGYNNLVDQTNALYNTTMGHRSLNFFGEGVESVNLLVDIIIVVIIIIVGLMVYLPIRWSIKETSKLKGDINVSS